MSRSGAPSRRPKLSYANVVATIALFLALGGGAVWAAGKITSSQIGNGAVKNKNLAKNAVKAKNIAKNAVTGAKIKNGAVNFNKLATGTNVIASATGGPVAANTASLQDLPLSSPISVTATAGQVLMVSAEARSTLTQAAASQCLAGILPTVNGNARIGAVMIMVAPSTPPEPEAPNGIPVAAVKFPVGLTQAGQAINIGAKVIGDADCTAASKIDQVAIVLTRTK